MLNPLKSTLLATTLGLVSVAWPQRPIDDYLERGTIEFTQLSNQPYRAGEYKQFRTIRKDSPSRLKVRYNALALTLTVKGTNIFPTVTAPSSLSGLVTTSSFEAVERITVDDTIKKLTKVIEVGTEVFASAKGDSPPLSEQDAEEISKRYITLFNQSGLKGNPTSMADAKSQVDDLVSSTAGTITDARVRLQLSIAEIETKINVLKEGVEVEADKSARAADNVADWTLELKRLGSLVTRYTEALTISSESLKAAQKELEEAVKAEKATQDPRANAEAKTRVTKARKAVKNAQADKIAAELQLQSTKALEDKAEDQLAKVTMEKEHAEQNHRAKQRELQKAESAKGRVQESLNRFDLNSGPLASLITIAKESAGFIYNCIELSHLYSTLEMDARGNELKVEVSFEPRTVAQGNASGGADPSTTSSAPIPTRLSASRTVTGDILPPGTRTFPVDFLPFHALSPSYSVGLVYSELRDEKPRAVADGDGTFTIFPGVRSEGTVKPIALLHLNIYKSGGFYTGPALGVIGSNHWAGWGAQYGRVNDRLSLNLGYEFGSVDRLNGVSYGPGQLRDTNLTSKVNRKKLALAVTYSFKIGG